LWGSLIGVIVGGAITFITTTGANWLKEKSDRERLRRAEICAISIRFIRAINQNSSDLMRTNSRSGEVLQVLQRLKEGGDMDQILAEFKKPPAASDVDAQLSVLEMMTVALAQAQAPESPIAESQGIIVEMRLIIPNQIVQLAAHAAFVAVKQKILVELKLAKELLGPINEALNEFINAVRKEVGLNKFEPPEGANPLLLEEIAAMAGGTPGASP